MTKIIIHVYSMALDKIEILNIKYLQDMTVPVLLLMNDHFQTLIIQYNFKESI
jgi:hypothetical protein